MSISDALNYPFRNNNLLKVLPVALTYGIILFIMMFGILESNIPIMILGFIGVIAIGLFIGGYYVSALRQLQNGDDNLPEYTIGENMKDGFLVGLAGLFYMLPVIIIFVVAFVLGGGATALVGASGGSADAAAGGAVLLMCGGMVVAFGLMIVLGAATQVAIIRFAAQEPNGLFGIGENWNLATGNFGKVLGLWWRTFVIAIVAGLISSALNMIVNVMFPEQASPFFDPTFAFWMVYAIVSVAAYTIQMVVGLAQYHLMYRFGLELGIGSGKIKRDEVYDF